MTNAKKASRSQFWLDCVMGLILLVSLMGMALNNAAIGGLNQSHPLFMAFIQFGILSTFGELLSQRLAHGQWSFSRIVSRCVIWGLVGIWIALAFPFTAIGVGGLVDAGLWPTGLLPFSISLWANVFSGYGLFMMLTQRWASQMLDQGIIPPWEIFSSPDFSGWIKVVLISLVVFWVPAHTITFLLPEAWRVLFAAVLGVALGVILGFQPKSPRP